MCGIVAYLGNENCIDIILNGLTKLQNRGYDSVGLSIIEENKFVTKKYASTEVNNSLTILKSKCYESNLYSNIGIGHTRWATHGAKTDINAHPHNDMTNCISIVHNGIIENYQEIKDFLLSKKYKFITQTDTEVIVNLISYYYYEHNNMNDAIKDAICKLKGTWALCIIHKDHQDRMWLVRNGSPLLIGFDNDYIIVSSENIGFNTYTQKYITVDNNDLLEIQIKDKKINFTENLQRYKINFSEKEEHSLPDNYSYWMLKEIHEQPNSILNCTNNGGRILNNQSVKLGGLEIYKDSLLECKHVILLGCGTSYHSALWSSHDFKKFEIFDTVQVIDGAEFSSYDLPKSGKVLLILLSQSGETKDLHRCIDIAHSNDAITLGVVNVPDSLIARESDCGVYLNAGREFAVASTKSFTCQCIVLSLISIWFSQNRNNHIKMRMQKIKDLNKMQFQINQLIQKSTNIFSNVIDRFKKDKSIFLLGKGQNEAIAKEGSLKIKEVSYIHAEGYSASALKHGPFALIEQDLPIIIFDTDENTREKINNAIHETVSRNACVFVISNNKNYKYNETIPKDNIFYIESNYSYHGLLANIIIQLLSYELALKFNINPDYPRNLAKVVTVE